MSNSLALFVGGLLPALLFGIGAIFQKQSNDMGIGQGSYLLYFSGGILLAALIAHFAFSGNPTSIRAGLFAAGHGALFGAGFVCLAIGLTVYQIPVSKLVPIANMSTLVAVGLGLVIFSEYAKVNVVNLIGGSVLIVAGGFLVARA